MLCMSPPAWRAVRWIDGLLDRRDRRRRLDESGDDRVVLDDDETCPGLADERNRAQRAEPEVLARLDHRVGQKPRHGGDVLAVGLPHGVEERAGQVAEHGALHLRTARDQLQVRHGIPPYSAGRQNTCGAEISTLSTEPSYFRLLWRPSHRSYLRFNHNLSIIMNRAGGSPDDRNPYTEAPFNRSASRYAVGASTRTLERSEEPARRRQASFRRDGLGPAGFSPRCVDDTR